MARQGVIWNNNSVNSGEDTVTYVMGRIADELGLRLKELHDLALENLGKSFDLGVVREVLQEPKLVAIKCLDSYDAARVLLLPRALQPGEAIAALIPDRDTLTLVPILGDNWAPL